MKFTASIVEADTNNNIANLLFADPETDPDMPSVLSFSRAMDIENSDYYFEVNDQSNSSYGGLEVVRISRGKIELKLKQELADQFEDADFLNSEVQFDLEEEAFQAVLETLHKIFDGRDILQVL